MPLEHEENFLVLNHECDPFGRMTPGSVLRRVQEIAVAHCEALGIDDAVYEATHAGFLLSRVSLRVNRMPGVREALRIRTRAWAPKRALYNRTTELLDGVGRQLCEVDARWVLVDTREKRILRSVPEGFPMPFKNQPTEEGHPMRMPKGGEAALVGEGVATYSLCDTNRHMNNTRYADLVCDALPIEALEKGPVRSLLLHYHSEIPLGAAYTLLGEKRDGSYYYIAQSDTNKNFEALVTL